jgi:hypothetical protein
MAENTVQCRGSLPALPLRWLAGAKTAKKHARNPYFPLKLQVLA